MKEICKNTFVIKNFLSPEECQSIIQVSEKQGFVSTNYDQNHRSNTRLVLSDEKFAQLCFQRIAPYIPKFVTWNNQQWIVDSINPMFRCCKYIPGQKCGRHTDFHHVESNTKRSFFTFMIYLNNVQSVLDQSDLDPKKTEVGGRTLFYQEDKEEMFSFHQVAEISPEQGLLVFFHHDNLHEGEELYKGEKYIIRSEIIYTLHV